jgi:hypothetical protein
MVEGLPLVEDGGEACPPDVLLPAQQPRRRAAIPEEALITAILEDAIDCVRKHRGTQTYREPRLFREAADWFLVDQPHWPFSFERICAWLGLDADGVRRALGLGRAADHRGDRGTARRSLVLRQDGRSR